MRSRPGGGIPRSAAHTAPPTLAVSPLRYSIVRSQAPRFHDVTSGVPFGVYQTDTAHKRTMESVARGPPCAPH